MSEPAVEDRNNFTFTQTDNSPLNHCGNSYQLCETSNVSHSFNNDLNKTFDLNKCDELIKASSGIKTVLEPFNKYTFDCINQKDIPGKLSQIENLDRLESDDSLGILPDLLNDELTLDPFKTELGFSDGEIHDEIDPEINENPASFIFSPSDNQFNKISLFLKNISTPLPNFGNDRRCSSTPKISATGQFVANTAEYYSSPQFFPDEEEEPIAGSCLIKFETDFNLDDLKNVKPLTSTCKAFSPPRLPLILNELNEKTDFKSEVNFKAIGNNLNVVQTFCHNVEGLCPSDHEDNIQNVNILNNTFQIKHSVPSTMKISQAGSNNCSEKEKVLTLDSTFVIPRNEISCNVDCEKTFVIDFNSTLGTEASFKSINKDRLLNETHVLEMDSHELFSKQQEQLTNVTFTKDLENITQNSPKHPCYVSHGSAFIPMTQILEETFSGNDFKPTNPIFEKTFSGNDFKAIKPILEEISSENDLNETKSHCENVLEYDCNRSHSASPEAFNIKENVTFSEKAEILPSPKAIQNDNYRLELASPKPFADNIFHEEAGEKNCFHDQINFTENENAASNKMPLLVAFQSIRDATFSEEIDERADKKIDKFHKSDSTKNVNSIIELVVPKSPITLSSTTFNEEAAGNICIHDQINCSENDLSNKMSHSFALEPIGDATFSKEIIETSDQEISKFQKRDSTKNVNSIIELACPKALVSFTLNQEVGKTSFGNQIDHLENKCDPANKMSHSDPLHSTSKNESSGKLVSLSKTNKSFAFSDGSEVGNLPEASVFQDSNDLIEQDAPNSQTIFSRKIASSLNLDHSDNCHGETNFPKAIEDSIFAVNSSKETEFCARSMSQEDCSFEISPKSSNIYASSTFSEKTDQGESDMGLVSNESDQDQISQNSLKEMTNASFSETNGELIPIPTENDKFRTFPKEINAPFSRLTNKDMKVQPERKINQCVEDSLGEIASTDLTKSCSNHTLSIKATDKLDTSLRSCSLESKTVVKSGLIKPTKIFYTKKAPEQRNDRLPIAKPLSKPIIGKRSIISDLNHTLNLSDNSTDKSFSKNVNRRLTLSCSSEIEISKCKNGFKKSFGIPSKLGFPRPESNFQKPRLDTKYSNGHLKDINTVNDKQNVLTQPDLISGKDPKIVTSNAVASFHAKRPISSKLSLPGKLPLKSHEIKKCGLESNAALTYTAEKNNIKIISCPQVIDLPRKEKLPEMGVNKANSGKNYSRHSIAANLPRTFLPFNNIPNKTCSKPTVIKQKSAPTSNSYKSDLLKPLSSMKPPNSIAKLKFSSLPKVQSLIKISSDESSSKSVFNKRPAPGNRKSNGFQLKPCIPEGEAVQFVEKQISASHMKQKDNERGKAGLTSSMLPSSKQQVVQPLHPLNVKKSNGQCNFLPMPKMMKGNIRSVIPKDVHAAQESQLINPVCQQTTGKLPQLRRIPAPRYNK